jgi:hypothetical protein
MQELEEVGSQVAAKGTLSAVADCAAKINRCLLETYNNVIERVMNETVT